MQQAPDGFRGTYNEVLAHEQKLGLSTGSEHEVTNLFEAPDGFRGSYDEVLAHEAKIGHTFCETTGNVVAHRNGPSAESVLSTEELGLARFVLPLHTNGVDSASELKGCTDAWLAAKTGMKVVHIVKFRTAVPDTTADLPAEASDGFKGSPVEVAAHEAKISSSQAQPPPPEANAQHDRVLIRLYEAPDGFRGTYDEVLAHEQKLGLAKGDEQAVDKDEATVMHLYEVCFTPKLRLISTL
jgi:hypothetical protein